MFCSCFSGGSEIGSWKGGQGKSTNSHFQVSTALWFLLPRQQRPWRSANSQQSTLTRATPQVRCPGRANYPHWNQGHVDLNLWEAIALMAFTKNKISFSPLSRSPLTGVCEAGRAWVRPRSGHWPAHSACVHVLTQEKGVAQILQIPDHPPERQLINKFGHVYTRPFVLVFYLYQPLHSHNPSH